MRHFSYTWCTSITIGLEAQPEFPQIDLTEKNAELLELMLANKAMITSSHELALLGAALEREIVLADITLR